MKLFPLILPPAEDDGLGVAILNSNADTNFSFTNALGMIPVGQARKLMAAFDHYPQARWIVALHHHLIEYPMPVAEFSERIGTALDQRQLVSARAQALCRARRRHARPPACRLDRRLRQAQGRLRPVAGDGAGNSKPTHFYVHALGPGPDGRLALMTPERIDLAAAEEDGDSPGNGGVRFCRITHKNFLDPKKARKFAPSGPSQRRVNRQRQA